MPSAGCLRRGPVDRLPRGAISRSSLGGGRRSRVRRQEAAGIIRTLRSGTHPSELMAFTLREATCTVSGSFNIDIFRPDRVAGRLPPPNGGEGGPGRRWGLGFARFSVRVRFPSRRTSWTVGPDMLLVSTLFAPAERGEPPPDRGGLVAGVLGIFPELRRTPAERRSGSRPRRRIARRGRSTGYVPPGPRTICAHAVGTVRASMTP